jgi:hypothetical protein
MQSSPLKAFALSRSTLLRDFFAKKKPPDVRGLKIVILLLISVIGELAEKPSNCSSVMCTKFGKARVVRILN